ncbi:MAG: hypothetical protein ABH919_02925 [bacterium]
MGIIKGNGFVFIIEDEETRKQEKVINEITRKAEDSFLAKADKEDKERAIKNMTEKKGENFLMIRKGSSFKKELTKVLMKKEV